jgi:Sodium/hydrogen exchanger family
LGIQLGGKQFKSIRRGVACRRGRCDIEVDQSVKSEESENHSYDVGFIAAGLSALCLGIGAMLTRRLHLPYTVGLVLAGMALYFSHVYIKWHLTKDLIFSVFLPPLVFEAALFIHWQVEEWATVALAQLDAENHYRLRATRGRPEVCLALLDKLDRSLGRRSARKKTTG